MQHSSARLEMESRALLTGLRFSIVLWLALLVLLPACARKTGPHTGPCKPGERQVNGQCVDYRPVCAELQGRYLTYPSLEAAVQAGATKLADGECCGAADDCERRGRWDQRCVARTDPSNFALETREDWFSCLSTQNQVSCQCGGPNGAPTCQFTTFENAKFMECYSLHLPNPPPEVAPQPAREGVDE